MVTLDMDPPDIEEYIRLEALRRRESLGTSNRKYNPTEARRLHNGVYLVILTVMKGGSIRKRTLDSGKLWSRPSMTVFRKLTSKG
jgi:hypothetical protein